MSAAKGRIRLYLADIRPLYQEKTQRYVYERLDEIRQKKADACRQPQARAASLAAGFLAQYALLQNGYGNCRISYGEKGQPRAEEEHMRAEGEQPRAEKGQLLVEGEQSRTKAGYPYLSLSHSGNYAVCAIADRPVGVDIQMRVPIRSGMLRHFFSPEERKRFEEKYELIGYPTESGSAFCDKAEGNVRKTFFLPKEAEAEFLRLWTAKESYMKLTGIGMGMGFAGICADLEKGTIWQCCMDQKGCDVQEAGKSQAEAEHASEEGFAAFLREYPAPEGYFLTACIADERGMCIWKSKN